MNKLFGLITCLLMICSISQAQYAGIEVYPKGDIFIYAGKDLNQHFKIDLWSTPGTEVAFSIGPKLGLFNLGFGASAGQVDDEVDLTYINTDLGFGLNFGPVHWQSYNLYQLGQNDVDDFILARQWLNYKDAPLGIVGHNIKCGDDDWQLNWGFYYDFGPIGVLTHNKLCLTKNLNGDGLWGTWVFEF